MNKNIKTTIFAAFAIGMILSVCFIGTPATNEDRMTLGANETAAIDMFVGDSFLYTPATNLSSVITPSGNGMTGSGGFLIWNPATETLSGTASGSGVYTVVLTANWSSGSLTQTATQTITFNVFDHISVTSSSSASALVGEGFNYTLTFTGAGDEVVGTPTVTNANGLSYNAGTKVVSGTPSSTGTTTFAWTITSPSSGDVKNFTLTITSYNNLAITSSATSETYVGASYSHTVTTSEPGATITADTSSIAGLGVTWISPSLSGTFSSAAVSNGSPFYNEYQILFTANATVGGLPAAASQSHTITIYAALAFLSAPTISDVTVMTEGLMGTLTAGVSGAISLSVDWGDGIVDPVDVDGSDTLLFASHEYAEAGSYTAKIIAINDFGETKSFAVLLAEGEEGWCGCECEACIMSEDCDGSECEEGCECRCCVPAEVGDDDSEDRGTVFWAFVTIGIILLIVGVFLLSKKHPLFGIALILIGALLLVQTLVLDIVETIKDLIGVKS